MNYPGNKKPAKSDSANSADSAKTDIMKKAEEAVRAFRMSNKPGENNKIQSDVLGSYTGMSYDGGKPDQDADDL